MVEKYGSVYEAAHGEAAKLKREETCLKKYGETNPIKNKQVRDKMKATNLKRYGAECVFQSDEIKNRIKTTCLERYGVENPTQNKEIYEKVKQSCLKLYGAENVMRLDYFKNKAMESFCKRGTAPSSVQQKQLFDMIKTLYQDCEVYFNKPCESFILDILVIKNGVKIDIEYDGWYWHQDQQKDIKRDYVLKKYGYKTLRVKSGRLLPEKEQIINSIDELVNSDKWFSHIYLEDWENPKTFKNESNKEEL